MNKAITYTETWVEEEPDVFVRQYKKFNGYTNSHIQMYTDSIGRLLELNKRTRQFYDYLIMNMNDFNIVSINTATKNAFNENLAKRGIPELAQATFYNIINKLKSVELIIKESHGSYLINPLYFNKGDIGSRIKKIRLMLEFQAGSTSTLSIKAEYEPILPKAKNSDVSILQATETNMDEETNKTKFAKQVVKNNEDNNNVWSTVINFD